jgi:uncharacterized phage-like protein YoqJ
LGAQSERERQELRAQFDREKAGIVAAFEKEKNDWIAQVQADYMRQFDEEVEEVRAQCEAAYQAKLRKMRRKGKVKTFAAVSHEDGR